MFEQQISRGMAWLDAEYPGWEESIDLDRLNLASTCNCILGQKFGDFAMRPMEMPCTIALGFDIRWAADRGDQRQKHAILTAEWRTSILARRTAAPKPAPAAAVAASYLPLTAICLR